MILQARLLQVKTAYLGALIAGSSFMLALESQKIQQAPALQVSLIDGPLSVENERFAQELVKELGIVQPINFVQPSAYFVDIAPILNYDAVFMPQENRIYIEQKWFNQLSDAEKRFMLGKTLLKVKYPEPVEPQGFSKFLDVKGLSVMAIEAVLGFALYKYLIKKQKFAGFTLNKWKSVGLAFLGVLAVELAVFDPIDAYYKDKAINAKFESKLQELGISRQVALDYFKKVEVSIAPQAHIICFKEYYKVLVKLIAYLQTQK